MKISKVTVGNGLDGFKFYGGDAKFTLIAESVPELTELNAFIELINSLSNKKVEAGLETSYGTFDLVLTDLISLYFYFVLCFVYLYLEHFKWFYLNQRMCTLLLLFLD